METKNRARVVPADTSRGIRGAVGEVFAAFGGVPALLKGQGDVCIKINAIDHKPFCHTDPGVLRETILHLKANGARNVFVIENCTQANFTRLVFEAAGIKAVCSETGAVPIYLDETAGVPVFLDGIEEFVDVSRFVYERLMEHRNENLYISMPKLKTHSMSQVTLSIKNQYGLVHQYSRGADHNYRLHKKLGDIYRVLRPDFALVDGLIATNHGHYPAEKNADRSIVKMDLLIGGTDPLSTDVVSAALMGFALDEVKHLRECAATGIGVGNMDDIEIVNRTLFEERKKTLTCELLEDFPPDLAIVRGLERCCIEGCRRNTETVVETFYRDHGGRGGFTILMGKGLDTNIVSNLSGRVHIAGGCAIGECGPALERRLGKGNVTMSPGCNNLALTVHALCKQMKVNPLSLVPMNPARALYLLATAKLKGSRANITPLF